MAVPQILAILRAKKGGLSFQSLVKELRLAPKDRVWLKKKLAELEEQGLVLRLKRRYFLRPPPKTLTGRMITTQRGYGFVRPDTSLGEDVFIPARYAGGALQGDLVEIAYKERGKKGKPEGRVIRILEKPRKSLLGVCRERGGIFSILPLDSPSSEELPLAPSSRTDLEHGLILCVDRETRRVLDVLGRPEDPGVDTRVVIQRFGLRRSFSAEALDEAQGIPEGISPTAVRGRMDYRGWLTVTIDGADAQDFDDAVSVKKQAGGCFKIGVHIADVSYYVRPQFPLDQEAFLRGTSVYFPGLTLPMLPEKLSNQVCSLRPREDKLTFSVVLNIDQKGEVVRSAFHPSIIRTAERLTYDAVFKVISGDEEEGRKYPRLVEPLLAMRDAAALLRKRRLRQGSLDFDLVEPELVYKDGKLNGISPSSRNEAHQIIEDFMVAANEAVACFLETRGFPLVYRIHPPPAVSDLKKLQELLKHFGIQLPLRHKPRARDLQGVLRLAEGRSEEKLITLEVLKSLRLAAYAEENQGHFGLAKKSYTHFTSPIRRYPDLVIHRLLKNALDGGEADVPDLAAVARRASEQERKGDEAERDLLQWRIFRLLKERLGDELSGLVVDTRRSGYMVELEDYFVEGFLPAEDFTVGRSRPRARTGRAGRRPGLALELGGRVRVILAAVDPILRRLTLAPA